MTEETELSNELLDLGLNLNEVNNNTNQESPCVKVKYKDRKLKGKLKKYESILHKMENVKRVTGNSQVPVLSFSILIKVQIKTFFSN
jgi:hypothetical protein